ncbi:MAG TPA: IPT/TIG domain-containing protein, partial [Terriglobales bacterium]|nr:IPT/TIG domain-containing protein [Terriglobales bacterium]
MGIRLMVRCGMVLGFLLSVFLSTGCGGGPSRSVPNSQPSLSSFHPSAGIAGTSVSLVGSNFANVKSISFNGQSTGSFLLNNPQLLTVIVPVNATSGKISILTSEGTTASTADFTVSGLAPVIQGFVPPQGPAGTRVSIAGTNFSDVSQVLFDGLATQFEVHGENEIVALVPAVAGSGKISLTTSQYNATSAAVFTVTAAAPGATPAPVISSFTPTSGVSGAFITVNGTNFTGATAVTFNGLAAIFAVNGSSQIFATVPNGAS